jgi:hypothetical protein
MAQIPVVSGGAQPVFATDTLNGPQLASNPTYTPAGVPTNLAGPKLDFFGLGLPTQTPDTTVGGANQAYVNGAIELILQTLQIYSTVAIYQVDATDNAVNMSVAIYPTGAFNTATDGSNNSATNVAALISAIPAIPANPPYAGFTFAGTTCTDVGFRLASTATSAS